MFQGEGMNTVIQTTINRYALHCPICGRDILYAYLRDEEPCVHVVYLYFDDVQNFAHINERHADIFDDYAANVWFNLAIEQLSHIQNVLPASILHLTLDTDRRTQGALTGVMRIGFDFDIVDNWSHSG